ncbi:MAG: HEAT repeat domain-containing protein [Acidobacteria bacterium]|nr:HEAT repeat domain-containing protein [Acidobacteriota bacterium]
MTKPIAEAAVIGDFSADAALEKFGRAYRFESRTPPSESRTPNPESRYSVSISHGGGPFQKFSVDYTLGFKRFQGYISKLPDGRLYVLPAFWHREARRWIDWKEIAPVPDDNHDLRQIWNVTCFNCHATNLAKNFDVASKTYKTDWTEMGIGCEACHGPGEAHVALMREWEKDPSKRPAYDDSSKNRELGRILKIFSPRSADPRAVYETCAYCHGNKRNYLTGFTPGDRVADYAEPFLMSEPIPDNDPQGEFWPDGRPIRFNRPQALMLSGCFRPSTLREPQGRPEPSRGTTGSGRAPVTCTNCHVAHGSKNEHSLKVAIREIQNGRESFTRQSDLLCVQCHKNVGIRGQGSGTGKTETGAPDPHTHHPPDSQGSRCVACHMADLNWRILIRRRDHTFQAPVPELTARYGEPNACTTCHDDKSPEWAARLMDDWYGDAERRRRAVFIGDTFYAAGTGDPAALPGLAKLAVDRRQGAFIRASAADFIGRLLGAPGASIASSSAAASAQTSFERGSPTPASGVRPSTLREPQGRPEPSRGTTSSGRTAAAGVEPRLPTLPRTPNPESPTPNPVAVAQYVNTLIGAASDPEAIVRIAAVQALGVIGDRRAVPPLMARTQDEARVVRSSAAASLFLLGVVKLDGPAGAALARAQDDYVASLKTFPDQAGDHAFLASFESARGHADEASRAIDAAIHLVSDQPQFFVIKGVILARLGRLKEAISEWQTARRLDPAEPSVGRLIAEAERQLGGR